MTSARPSLVVVAGVNGSGKSTFAVDAKGTELLLGQATINPDDLSKDAAKEFPTLNQAGADLAGAERAEKAVWRAIAQGDSVAVETVLSSKKFAPVLVAARRRRFKTRLIFIAVPTLEQSLALRCASGRVVTTCPRKKCDGGGKPLTIISSYSHLSSTI